MTGWGSPCSRRPRDARLPPPRQPRREVWGSVPGQTLCCQRVLGQPGRWPLRHINQVGIFTSAGSGFRRGVLLGDRGVRMQGPCSHHDLGDKPHTTRCWKKISGTGSGCQCKIPSRELRNVSGDARLRRNGVIRAPQLRGTLGELLEGSPAAARCRDHSYGKRTTLDRPPPLGAGPWQTLRAHHHAIAELGRAGRRWREDIAERGTRGRCLPWPGPSGVAASGFSPGTQGERALVKVTEGLGGGRQSGAPVCPLLSPVTARSA